MKKKNRFIAIITFVILLVSVMLVTMEKKDAQAITYLGQVGRTPDPGWRRYDDTDSKIIYSGSGWQVENNTVHYNSTEHYNGTDKDAKITFRFYGSKLRLITDRNSNRSSSQVINVSVDGVNVGSFNTYGDPLGQRLSFEKTGLTMENHVVEITTNMASSMTLDAIDIDEAGYLIEGSAVIASELSLNKTSLSLNIGQTEVLIATVKPDNAENKEVTWSSSDETIATVDENGKVTAIKPGNVTITAKTTDGSNLTATCDVTVIQPSNDRAILAITMTNGQTKEYDLPNSEIEAFTNWFDSSNGKGQPKFGFNKKIQPYKEVKEYVVFDKISSYEVRTYTVSN
ncbi:Ig-like domain-containing protein [Clostridium intestinale]|uniref:Cell adhesion domain-containing protein n=1 Tax=Clostridium intestinale URNW TaxID=1294142 RepID=U2NR15_9CLOT|nr:Ig-like domain-containing protein [Clostridium intestinale]ERK31326.1 cell adhesion domain-containing protein [Clostridium intestinale URNW]